jgi:hypothetical protein
MAGRKAAPATLGRCVLLAVLLHLWLVLLLGSAPGGTARRGEGVWGAINVTLQRSAAGPDGAAPAAPPQPPQVAGGPTGNATQPRWGGAVRERVPAAATEPGAARVGEWAPAPVPALRHPTPAVSEPATPRLAPAAPEARPAAPPLPGRVVEERVRPPAAPQAPAVPAAPAAPAEPDAPAPALPPKSLPAAAPTLAPVPALPRTPALVAEPLPQPAPIPALARVPPPITAAVVAPVVPQLVPPTVASTVAPAVAPAVTPVVAPAAPPANAPRPALAPAAATAVAAPPLPGGASGAPDAGAQTGHDIATAPSRPASAPRLNLDYVRPRGGELSRYAAPGVLQLLPRPPESADKLARDINKAAKDDCRTAHSGMGVLALVPLVADAVSKEGGCKW